MNSHAPRRFANFLKSTLIGGIFVLFPVIVLAIIIGKAISVAYEAVHPVVELLPFQTASGIAIAGSVAIGSVVALCFLAGLLARTALATWMIKQIETALLSNLPGYGLMKSMGKGLVGADRGEKRQTVLVRFEHSTQLGFLMEHLTDDRLVVFVPGVPSPWSGALHIVTADRVETIDVSTRNAIDVCQCLGVGSKRFLVPPKEPGLSS